MTFYGYIMSHKLCTLCNIVESQNRTNITKQVVMAIMVSENTAVAGACPGFLKGGGPISRGSLKKGHQIFKGGGPMV